MDDEAALLSAIAAHPAEDTPRLAYADYLDEHGHPIRAEFIRVQCAIRPLEDAPTAVQYQYIHLWKRQQELLEHHRRDLIGPLADAVHERDVVFDRGFVTELLLSLGTFCTHANSVAALKPLPPVVTVREIAEAFDRFVALPGPLLDVITRIDMGSERYDSAVFTTLEDLDQLSAAARWTRLRTANLEGCEYGDVGIRPLSVAGTFPALVELDLSGNDISDEGVAELVAGPLFPRLTSLVLGANPISDEGARLLAAAPGKLQYLNLKFTAITREGQQALLRRKGTKVDLF